MEMKINSIMFVLLTSVSVEAITQFLKSETFRTVDQQKTEIHWETEKTTERDKTGNVDDSKAQREIATVSPSTSSVELVDAKPMSPDKTANPVVVAYFIANLDKTRAVYGVPGPDPRGLSSSDYASSYRSYGLQAALGIGGHVSEPYAAYAGYRAPSAGYRAPSTGYRDPSAGYGYGYTYGGYDYPVLGKIGRLGRKLRLLKNHLLWRGLAKHLF